MYKSYVDFCELCGNAILSGGIIDTNTAQPYLICDNCEQYLHTCASCLSSSSGCAFEQDPSPIPKIIMKEIRQGNAIIQQTVKNPKRIDETCKKKCFCFDENFGCLRQNNWCEKWKIVWEKD